MGNHTPGSWSRTKLSIHAPSVGREVLIARVMDGLDAGGVDTPEEATANADLIRAAPDLLAACKDVDERWHLCHVAIKRGDTQEATRLINEWQDTPPAPPSRAPKETTMGKMHRACMICHCALDPPYVEVKDGDFCDGKTSHGLCDREECRRRWEECCQPHKTGGDNADNTR